MAGDRAAAEAMLRGLIDRFWNGGPGYDSFGEFFQPDVVLHSDGTDYVGAAGIGDGFARPFYDACPDLTYDIRQLSVGDDYCAMRYRGRGHLSRDMGGARGTGQAFEYHGIAMFRLKDGRIAEVWSQGDFGAWLAKQPCA
jgi:predicted ester cyclase